MMEAALTLYERVVDRNLLIRRLTLAADGIIPEEQAADEGEWEQMELFGDWEARQQERRREDQELKKRKSFRRPCFR